MESRCVPLARSPGHPINAIIVKAFFPANLRVHGRLSHPSRGIGRRPLPLRSGVSRTTLGRTINASSDSGWEEGEMKGSGGSGRRDEEEFGRWDVLTAKFAGAANVPFLLLQMPQIVLNCRNLMAGNSRALFAVPWIGMLTGLLGNLSLLSYFAQKKETEAVLVQTLGVLSTYAVIVQLTLAEAMPPPTFIATSTVVACGMLLNFLYYFSLLPAIIWKFWEDFITIGGLSVLPQVVWSTFVPYIPQSILPGAVACSVAAIAVIMARTGKLSNAGLRFVSSISGWTATLLFMWMPVAQMWTNYLNPDNIKGLSAFTMVLAMMGNGLLIPRALFIRDLMWFTGSAWASILYGWGNLICMYCCESVSWKLFYAATLGLITWIGITFWRDTKAYGHNSPAFSLRDLILGKSHSR